MVESFRRVIFAAVLIGSVAGVIVTLLHQSLTVPLILHAESFETLHVHGTSPETVWHPHSLRERRVATAISDVLTGIGFALVLMAVWQFRDERPDWRQGLAWGVGGFLAMTVAPSLGLPAELPGTAAAALRERQLWWIATAVLTAVGLAVACFARPWWLRILALASLALPHLVGAPQPLDAASVAPRELLQAFQQSVLLCNFLFWVVLGVGASYCYRALKSAA